METALVADFADGSYKFWLPMPRVIAIQREGGESILSIFYNLGDNLGAVGEAMVLSGPSAATLSQCHSVIRNALVGGNEARVGGETVAVGDTLARELVETYCYPARPAMHDIGLAWQILKAAIYGVEVPEAAKKNSKIDDPATAS